MMMLQCSDIKSRTTSKTVQMFLLFYSEALDLSGLLLGLRTLPESVLKTTGHGLHVPHAASSDSAAVLRLGSVIVVPHLLGGVSTGRASLLLDVERHLAAPTAGGVRLVVPFSE